MVVPVAGVLRWELTVRLPRVSGWNVRCMPVGDAATDEVRRNTEDTREDADDGRYADEYGHGGGGVVGAMEQLELVAQDLMEPLTSDCWEKVKSELHDIYKSAAASTGYCTITPAGSGYTCKIRKCIK